ncbi:hypothetical protein [Methanoculleus sp.]|uniref:hypothetical protein n=1 Tax=Methanoculleus sp. TaxID=90427 RepID=UPI0026134E83|nr:hypothetical protein [Methanoculleus sp.]MDI6866804.1 hypothetical protein [Methanoculleus sp.]
MGKPCQGAGTEFHREVGDALWDTVSLEIRHLRDDTFPLPSLACHEYYLSQNPAHLEIRGEERAAAMQDLLEFPPSWDHLTTVEPEETGWIAYYHNKRGLREFYRPLFIP